MNTFARRRYNRLSYNSFLIWTIGTVLGLGVVFGLISLFGSITHLWFLGGIAISAVVSAILAFVRFADEDNGWYAVLGAALLVVAAAFGLVTALSHDAQLYNNCVKSGGFPYETGDYINCIPKGQGVPVTVTH